MESLGEFLKRERELRNITLEEISSATKISIRFLEALEQDKYDLLPTEAFVKGFLRSYAQYIGIDPDEVILIYQENKEQQADSLRTTKSSSPARNSGSKIFMASLAILFFLTGLLIYFFFQIDSQQTALKRQGTFSTEDKSGAAPSILKTPTPDASLVQATSAQQQVAESIHHPSEENMPDQMSPLGGTNREREEAKPPSTEYFTLTAAAESDTWLRITIDEKEQHDLLLRSGKTANWQAKEKIVLTVGNVRGTRLDLNGKEIPLPATTRNVLKDYVITRETVP